MTTTISRDDVLHLAQLSNLHLSDDEVASLQQELGGILEYIKQLGELDTTGIEPTYQVTDLENVSRDDVHVAPLADRRALLGLAPAEKDEQIQVPKVL
jgi:aspartyl-tRNA(Asn)/glutamyl-tRNA(Gln) amidotransferase subunit C